MLQDFSSLDEALNWTERAFDNEHRLRFELVGGQPYEWTLERVLPDGGAIGLLKSGYPVLFPWIRKRQVRYFTNSGAPPRNHISAVG